MDTVNLTMSQNEVGQLIEGIEVLIEQWESTERFLVTGIPEEDACIREAHRPEEAAAIASDYRKIVTRIREQSAAIR